MDAGPHSKPARARAGRTCVGSKRGTPREAVVAGQEARSLRLRSKAVLYLKTGDRRSTPSTKVKAYSFVYLQLRNGLF